VKFSKRFDEAYRLASRLHRGRTKKGLVPELAHLLGTAGLTVEYGGTEDEAIAALLHDAVEARGEIVRPEILRRFGARVASIVDRCTDSGSNNGSWRERKPAYVERLAAGDTGARRVAACDKLENVRRLTAAYRILGESLWRKLGQTSRQDRLWYYRQIVHAFRKAGGGVVVDELERAVNALRRLVRSGDAHALRAARRRRPAGRHPRPARGGARASRRRWR
jgi:(p)ppGpp synthase/HD superfamily hydrolase